MKISNNLCSRILSHFRIPCRSESLECAPRKKETERERETTLMLLCFKEFVLIYSTKERLMSKTSGKTSIMCTNLSSVTWNNNFKRYWRSDMKCSEGDVRENIKPLKGEWAERIGRCGNKATRSIQEKEKPLLAHYR